MTPSDDCSVAMNFTWIEDRHLAGCREPRTDDDFGFLVSKGVRLLVRLAHEEETGISARDVQQHGLEDHYEPTGDLAAPSQDQIDRIIAILRDAARKAKPVAVACAAGYGRTGTILAAYFVYRGFSAEQAIRRLVLARPGSTEILKVRSQLNAVMEFERRLKLGHVGV